MLRSFPSIVAAGFVSMGTMFLIGTVYLGAGEDDLGLGISIARAAPSRELPPDVASMEAAERLLKQSGVQGGFVVHLGCGDGRLTAWLGAKQEYTVQGLDADPAKVADAREHIGEVRGYGRVSAEELRGTKLPYADNLINLVVVDDPCGVASQEIDRVLAPGGVVMTRTGSASTKRVKPRAGDIDEWTHYLHDATGNPVASDDRVGPPRALQWVAPPLWLRSHETPSGFEALVSAGGRVFYIFDEGVIGITDQRLPERWSLVCRDAFNGKLLWKVPLKQWGWPQWAAEKFADKDWTVIRGARTVVPEENQRRLVAHGDRLYATLSYVAPLSILDAATGEVRATVDATGPVREILAADGVVLTLARTESSSDTSADTAETAADDETGKGKRERKTRAKAKAESPRGTSLLTAVDGATTKVLWQRAVSPVASLMLSIEDGRVIYQSGNTLAALTLNDGKPLWEVKAEGKGRTLLGHAGRIFLYAGNKFQAFDAATGDELWSREVPSSSGSESPDMFVSVGLLWRGMIPVKEDLVAAGKSQDAMALGFDLATGEQKKQIVVRNLRSPEHHHRCYRNKATERYIISGMEGAEYMDLVGDDHGQNNWLRGACKLGIMPCNGLLYVPADQCFCQPGAKVLGFTACAAEQPGRLARVPDEVRLTKGAAYGKLGGVPPAASNDDWPTFRQGASRHGSNQSEAPAEVLPVWRTQLPAPLTQPVMCAGRVYVAAKDAHTVFAVDASTGEVQWKFTAGARIDSPPTIYGDAVLVGSADGHVYCLRASDGELAWRLLAARQDCRIANFDQLESVWPVHGSVLVDGGVAYVTAGRSSYLDGGVDILALDPLSGRVLHRTTVSGPMPTLEARDEAFYLPGANSDVLVSEGRSIFMRQKQFSPELEPIESEVLSNKGEKNIGLHVFSTSGLLDDSWYNRAFWMYAKRWPGFQLAWQAPKAGQLLVMDDENTYGLKVYYRRNVHSPMFFPGKEGYLIFADRNTTEPQIVGEPGAKPPVEWLPQSDLPRDEINRLPLDSPAFGLDKMMGYTRAEPPLWTTWVPIRVRAMAKAGGTLLVAGARDEFEPADPFASFEGRSGALLASIAATDGRKLGEVELPAVPVFDGLIVACGRVFASLEDGSLICLAGNEPRADARP